MRTRLRAELLCVHELPEHKLHAAHEPARVHARHRHRVPNLRAFICEFENMRRKGFGRHDDNDVLTHFPFGLHGF